MELLEPFTVQKKHNSLEGKAQNGVKVTPADYLEVSVRTRVIVHYVFMI